MVMRSHLRAAFILALTLLLLAFFLRGADLAQVWSEMRHASLGLLVAAMLVNLATYPIRVVRWRYLLRPVGRVAFEPALTATMIGFGASVVLPARAGEFLRPYVLARREGVSGTAAFATVVLERVLDLLAVLLLLGVFLLGVDAQHGPFAADALRSVRIGGAVAALTALALLVLLGVLAGHPDWLARATRWVERCVPSTTGRLSPLVERFTLGLATVRQPGRLLVAVGLSVPLWMTIAAGIWLAALAFNMTVPYSGSFLIVAFLVIGVAVPTPGAIGGFHAAFQVAVTSFYGVPDDRAVGGAIVLHALSFLPIVLIGALLMMREGLSVRRVRELAAGRDGDTPAGSEAMPPVREAEGIR